MNIDEQMMHFRLASRELFNHYFRIADPYNNDGWQQEARFSDLEHILFSKLVAEPLLLHGAIYGTAQPKIFVELRDSFAEAQVMLNREIDSGYWDYPITRIDRDASMVFVSFFDWDQLDYRDNQYVRAQVLAWPTHPDTEGKHVLIESMRVKFVGRQGVES